MRRTPVPPVLRQCVLAVSVLSDVDVLPSDDGVRLARVPHVVVPWTEISDAVGLCPPDGDAARRRVEGVLRLHEFLAVPAAGSPARLRDAARVVALPAGHVDHLGAAWVREPLPGGALDLGVGVVGLEGAQDRPLPLPPSAALASGIDLEGLWPSVRAHADRMGALAARRLARDGLEAGVLRPVGGCDVLALLVSPLLRARLAGGDGTGMRALAAPTRRRGWFDASRIDPAFVAAAWSATDEADRGVPRPLLVTADEVAAPARR